MEHPISKNITVGEIPPYQYEGYYWYSDQQSPGEINHESILEEWFTILPFVVEANFYAKKEKVSIRVQHIDGVYKVTLFDLNQANAHTEYREYIGHDISSATYWMAEGWTEFKDDELLEGMSTLIPSWSAFIGFSNP
jgi:CRISPR type III-associated protein (TIGR04423 family)